MIVEEYDKEELDYLQELLVACKYRLDELEEQKALLGADASSILQDELENTKDKVDLLSEKLSAMTDQTTYEIKLFGITIFRYVASKHITRIP